MKWLSRADWAVWAAYAGVAVAWYSIRHNTRVQLQLAWLQVRRDYLDRVLLFARDTIKASQKFASEWQVYRWDDTPDAYEPAEYAEQRRRIQHEYYGRFREFEREIDAAREFFRQSEDQQVAAALDQLHASSIVLFRYMAVDTGRRRNFDKDLFERQPAFVRAVESADACVGLASARLRSLYAEVDRRSGWFRRSG